MPRNAVDVRRRYLAALGHGAPATRPHFAPHSRRPSYDPLHPSPLRTTSSSDRLDALGDGRHSPLYAAAAALASSAAAAAVRTKSSSVSTGGSGGGGDGIEPLGEGTASAQAFYETSSGRLGAGAYARSMPATTGHLLGLGGLADILSSASDATRHAVEAPEYPVAAAPTRPATRAIPMPGSRARAASAAVLGSVSTWPLPATAAAAVAASGPGRRSSATGTDEDAGSSSRDGGDEVGARNRATDGALTPEAGATGSGAPDDDSDSRSHGAASSASGLGFDFDDAPRARVGTAGAAPDAISVKRGAARVSIGTGAGGRLAPTAPPASAASGQGSAGEEDGDEDDEGGEDAESLGDLPVLRGARGSAGRLDGSVGLFLGAGSGGGGSSSGGGGGGGAGVRRASLDAQASLQASGLLSSTFIPPHLQQQQQRLQLAAAAAGSGGGGDRPVDKARPRNV